MSSLPPAYKFAPVILIVALTTAVYLIASSIEKKIPTPSSIGKIIEEAKIVVEGAREVIEEARKLTEAARPKRARVQPVKKQSNSQALLLLQDGKGYHLSVSKSDNVTVTFQSVKQPGEDKPILKLLVNDIGSGRSDESFASGVIDFIPAIRADRWQSISIEMKSSGVKHFGLAALSKDGGNYLRWDFPQNPGRKNWGTLTIPFNFFNVWKYDTITRQYTSLKKGTLPKKIDQIQIYVKKEGIEGNNNVEISIRSLQLQDKK